MTAMTTVLGRRSWLLAGLVCAGLGASVMWAVQSGASAGIGSAARAAAPTPPKPPAGAPKTAAATAAVEATNAHCGQVLTASLTLNGDLFCAYGTALTITANSVVLNLSGHRIDGAGFAQIGVYVQGNSDTVENGVVSNFSGIGVEVNNPTGLATSDTVSAVRAVGDTNAGIEDAGKSTKITNSTATRETYGILSFGSGGTYSGDHELNNTGNGLYLGVGHINMVVTSNVANGNAAAGIQDNGLGDTLTKNTANFNGGDGIDAAGDPTVIDGGGNLAKGNDYVSGNTPRQCYGVVCS